MLAALGLYESRVLPAVDRELDSWRLTAAAIPDPLLRGCAVQALTEKASNPRAVAVFATLAPGSTRRAVIHATTALQVAIDYLDSLGEQPGPDRLRDGLQLHRSLGAALDPGTEREDWYAEHPRGDDGGYLEQLLDHCQAAVAALPSREIVLPIARSAALRCGEGQSHTHATATGSHRELEAWASGLPVGAGFEWWEIAAGASSSVAAHALIALAGVAGATASEAELVDAAYFPAIGALTVLLDDLVDRDADLAAGEHNYLSYYPSAAVAAERIAAIAESARDSLAPLRGQRWHAAILTGVLAHYLALSGAATPYAGPIRDRLLAQSPASTVALTKLLRLRGDD
jgi:tetraprenyl-beta-curcumene synthase